MDDSFPMKLWDKLLPQTVLTLNLLRQSNFAPTVSAYQYVRRIFDYNKMLLAPMVQYNYMRVVKYEEHGQRIQPTDGTSKPHLNTIAATRSM